MELMLSLNIPKPKDLISHHDKILSVGSCFTEHIGNSLKELKFKVLQNPNGILFDPESVCKSLVSYTKNISYTENDLFQLNELWHSWDYHSRFSSPDKSTVIQNINRSRNEAAAFVRDADWLIITLGSAFSYRLTKDDKTDVPVANCHRAPAQWFQKYLIPAREITERLTNTLEELSSFNKNLKYIFTISPVRHIRDGVIENNRSKARLIEAVHEVVNAGADRYYFPSYELVIDVLRDYRFYAEDLVHPNYLATDFVLEKFLETFTADPTRKISEEIRKLNIARKHRPSHPGTEAHKSFMKAGLEKAKLLQEQYPYIDLSEEITWFGASAQ